MTTEEGEGKSGFAYFWGVAVGCVLGGGGLAHLRRGMRCFCCGAISQSPLITLGAMFSRGSFSAPGATTRMLGIASTFSREHSICTTAWHQISKIRLKNQKKLTRTLRGSQNPSAKLPKSVAPLLLGIIVVEEKSIVRYLPSRTL